jgi:hypothetical protein
VGTQGCQCSAAVTRDKHRVGGSFHGQRLGTTLRPCVQVQQSLCVFVRQHWACESGRERHTTETGRHLCCAPVVFFSLQGKRNLSQPIGTMLRLTVLQWTLLWFLTTHTCFLPFLACGVGYGLACLCASSDIDVLRHNKLVLFGCLAMTTTLVMELGSWFPGPWSMCVPDVLLCWTWWPRSHSTTSSLQNFMDKIILSAITACCLWCTGDKDETPAEAVNPAAEPPTHVKTE